MWELFALFSGGSFMKRILLIDDSRDSYELLVYQLAGTDYVISWVENMAEANKLIFAKQSAFDLLLIDLNMPGMKGNDIASIYSDTLKGKGILICLYSASNEDSLRAQAKQIGAKFLLKGLERQTLLYRLGKMFS